MARVGRITRVMRRRWIAVRRRRPEYLQRLVGQYHVGTLLLEDGRVPVRWFRKAANFGDAMSPWLISKMTGREVVWSESRPHYVVIGSILRSANPCSVVWGTGSFGTEGRVAVGATFTAVRGPLTRARLVARKVACPEVYGDPALLAPAYHAPKVRKTHAYGIVMPWSDCDWHDAELGPGVRLIDLGTTDVEGVIDAMLSCRRLVTASLHGLIVADAYGIPSAWLRSRTTYGGPYKFFDYFASVGKFRTAQDFDMSIRVTAERLRDSLDFDRRPIVFNHRALLDACPFLERIDDVSLVRAPDGVLVTP